MAGHNKWTQIKRQKAITDGKKSKIFSKFSRLITLESKKANGNVTSPSLAAAIAQAKSFNMPNDNIDRAVKKGVGGDSGAMESVLYEGYGPEGAALIIEGLTDNRNKASAEVKHILSKHGGSLGAIGSVTWAFEKKEGKWEPTTTVPITLEGAKALAAIIDELEENDEIQEVFTNAEFPENFEA
jgi:YebC/PmpR family DNA-binding regulatory protein